MLISIFQVFFFFKMEEMEERNCHELDFRCIDNKKSPPPTGVTKSWVMKNGSSSPLLSKKEWIPDSQRRNCSLCDVKFSFSTRKHHCRWCGEVVCASCSKKRVKMEGTPRRICNTCFEKEFPSKRPASENVQKSLSPQQLKEKEVPKTPKHPQLPQVEKPLLLDRAYVFFQSDFTLTSLDL